MRFLKQYLPALLPVPYPIFFLPDPAHPAHAFAPLTESLEQAIAKSAHKSVPNILARQTRLG